MKTLLSLLFLSSIVFANYDFKGENSGKIDMHGGKSDKLLSKPSRFSSPKIQGLGNININKPNSPFAPKALIEKKKINPTEIKKKNKKQ